jgi:ERCC4-type nuclease
MKIKVDNREKGNNHILEYFDTAGIEYITGKPCSIGDYCNLDNPNVFIERKASWEEFAGNCGKQHARFKRELERLDECGGRMAILVETEQPLSEWKSKRTKMAAAVMVKIIEAWKRKHNIKLMQCKKWDAGIMICQILSENNNEIWERKI